MGTQSRSLCVWELTTIKRTHAYKQGKPSKSMDSSQQNSAKFCPQYDHISLGKCKRRRSRRRRIQGI